MLRASAPFSVTTRAIRAMWYECEVMGAAIEISGLCGGLRCELRQSSLGTVAIGWKMLANGNDSGEDKRSRGSGGRLCWRATGQGILCWKLILMRQRGAAYRSSLDFVFKHQDRFPHAWENSKPLAESRPAFSRTRPASNKPGPSAAAERCKTGR